MKEYLCYSGGMNGFLYPHVLYEAFVLGENSWPIITGYMGSELLRNAHFGEAVTSTFGIYFLTKGENYFVIFIR